MSIKSKEGGFAERITMQISQIKLDDDTITIIPDGEVEKCEYVRVDLYEQLEKDSDDAWNVIKAAYSLEMLLDALGSRHSLRDAGPDLDSLTKTLEPFKKRLETLLIAKEQG